MSNKYNENNASMSHCDCRAPVLPSPMQSPTPQNTRFCVNPSKRVRDASIYASKKISLKFLFLSDIFLFPPIRQQVPILA